MIRTLRLSLALPIVLVGALAAGCGGGKQQVSAAELVQKADQACQEEQNRFTEIQATPPANASEAADQTKALVQAAEDAGSTISGLEPPDDLRAQFDSYVNARDEAVDQMKKGQDAAENQDSHAYGAAQAAVTKGAPHRKKLAGSLGFKVCSRNAGAA
jgi:hypothetical protein